jgi:hypothetical protein
MTAFINVAEARSVSLWFGLESSVVFHLRRSKILHGPHFQLLEFEANLNTASFVNFNPKLEIVMKHPCIQEHKNT